MPFQVTQRQTIVFIAGLALGIAAAWALIARQSDAPAHAGKKSPVAAAKAAGAAPVSVAVGACAFKPVVSTAASDDGRVNVQAELSGRGPKEIDAWLLDGKEAVAAGRQHDAEADFLMACRAAEELGDAGVLPQAEAMYYLGRHYAGLAGASEPRSGELWKRAGSLFAASHRAFDARYGSDSDKTRFAAKGLAEVVAHNGGAPIVAAAPAPAAPTAPAKTPEAKVAKVAPPAPAKAAPEPKAVAQHKVAPEPKVVAEPKPAPEPKVVAEPKPAPEPKVAREPKAAAEPKVAAAPATPRKAPEPAVAAVRSTPPAPRATPPVTEATGEATGQATIMEPPARAVGSARGRIDEPFESSN